MYQIYQHTQRPLMDLWTFPFSAFIMWNETMLMCMNEMAYMMMDPKAFADVWARHQAATKRAGAKRGKQNKAKR